MIKINISLSEKVKPMKPMHGGGQPPMALQFGHVDTYHFTHMHYLTELLKPITLVQQTTLQKQQQPCLQCSAVIHRSCAFTI